VLFNGQLYKSAFTTSPIKVLWNNVEMNAPQRPLDEGLSPVQRAKIRLVCFDWPDEISQSKVLLSGAAGSSRPISCLIGRDKLQLHVAQAQKKDPPKASLFICGAAGSRTRVRRGKGWCFLHVYCYLLVGE